LAISASQNSGEQSDWQLQLDKGDAENFIEFGRACLLAGEKDLAAIYFTRAVKADAKDVDVWLGISNAYADLMLQQRKSSVPSSTAPSTTPSHP
jgi:hypothetical protein